MAKDGGEAGVEAVAASRPARMARLSRIIGLLVAGWWVFQVGAWWYLIGSSGRRGDFGPGIEADWATAAVYLVLGLVSSLVVLVTGVIAVRHYGELTPTARADAVAGTALGSIAVAGWVAYWLV